MWYDEISIPFIILLLFFSETTAHEVIKVLLTKFYITDNPHKFALYEKHTSAEGESKSIYGSTLNSLAVLESSKYWPLQNCDTIIFWERFIKALKSNEKIMKDYGIILIACMFAQLLCIHSIIEAF